MEAGRISRSGICLHTTLQTLSVLCREAFLPGYLNFNSHPHEHLVPERGVSRTVDTGPWPAPWAFFFSTHEVTNSSLLFHFP